jgi:hypothetical protein
MPGLQCQKWVFPGRRSTSASANETIRHGAESELFMAKALAPLRQVQDDSPRRVMIVGTANRLKLGPKPADIVPFWGIAGFLALPQVN